MRSVPVAAADYVVPVLAGPTRSAVVSAVFSEAIVVSGVGPGADTLVLTGPRAIATPLGVRSLESLPMTPIGSPARVGGGELVVAGTTFLLGRTWSSRVPAIDPSEDRLAELAERARPAPIGLDRDCLQELAAALWADRHPGLVLAVQNLVGLGAGSTPAGDDVLAGLMVALYTRRRTELAVRVAEAIDVTRTSPYSAALLAAAGAGHAALEALAALRWLHGPTPADLCTINVSGPEVHSSPSGPQMITDPHPVDRLLGVGHTSGADLTAGLLLGLGLDRAQVDPARIEATV